jgi:hypothetical protein
MNAKINRASADAILTQLGSDFIFYHSGQIVFLS